MDLDTLEKLDLAVDRYVSRLSIEELLDIVAADTWAYYKRSATDDEVQEFITEMQVTDEDVEQ